MHFDEERVQRLLHGELEPEVDLRARRHLGECPDCRTLLDEARMEEAGLFDRLRGIDHEPPSVSPSELFGAAQLGAGRWRRWAAGVALLAAAGGVAYASPGSPLPSMVRQVLQVLLPVSSPAGSESQIEPAAPAGAGIALEPTGPLTIRFTGRLAGGVATVMLTESKNVVVRAVEGTAAFSSDVDRLSVQLKGPARLEILIPRTAPRVELLAGEDPIFRADSAGVATSAPRTADGKYEVRLDRPAP